MNLAGNTCNDDDDDDEWGQKVQRDRGRRTRTCGHTDILSWPDHAMLCHAVLLLATSTDVLPVLCHM
jgi:hypothetical protein